MLTPLAIDPAHPFPHLHNKSLNLLLRIERRGLAARSRQLYAALQVPSVIRTGWCRLPGEGDGRRRFVLLEDVIGPDSTHLFGGYRDGRGGWPSASRATATSTSRRTRSRPAVDDQGDRRSGMGRAGPAGDLHSGIDEGFLAQLLAPRSSSSERRLQGRRPAST